MLRFNATEARRAVQVFESALVTLVESARQRIAVLKQLTSARADLTSSVAALNLKVEESSLRLSDDLLVNAWLLLQR